MKKYKLDNSVYISITNYGKKKTTAFSITVVDKELGAVLEQILIEYSACRNLDEYNNAYNYYFIKLVGKYKCRAIESTIDEEVFYNVAKNIYHIPYLTLEKFEKIQSSKDLNNQISNNGAVSNNDGIIVDNLYFDCKLVNLKLINSTISLRDSYINTFTSKSPN